MEELKQKVLDDMSKIKEQHETLTAQIKQARDLATQLEGQLFSLKGSYAYAEDMLHLIEESIDKNPIETSKDTTSRKK